MPVRSGVVEVDGFSSWGFRALWSGFVIRVTLEGRPLGLC